MLKCDMCKDEIEAGGKPICVTGCPMRALDWGTREEMIEKYGEGDVEVEPLPADTTDPNLILTPHRNAQKSGSAPVRGQSRRGAVALLGKRSPRFERVTRGAGRCANQSETARSVPLS